MGGVAVDAASQRHWQKPPFMAASRSGTPAPRIPARGATTPTALAAVQAGHADGITYILTEQRSVRRHRSRSLPRPSTHSIDVWAQNFMRVGRHSYQEVTPSGDGLPHLGFGGRRAAQPKIHAGDRRQADRGRAVPAHQQGADHHRLHARSAIKQLTNIDKAIDWAVVWGERRKAAAAEAAAPVAGNGFDSDGCRYTIEQIEAMIRNGAPPGSDRSAVFHAIIGHLSGCGWDAERIFEHVGQFPDGIGAKYIAEGRLTAEIARSLGKYQAGELPLFSDGGWVNGCEGEAAGEGSGRGTRA